MTIRSKIITIVLPLLVVPLVLTLIVSTLSARNGITMIATDFLRFKSDSLMSYTEGQWALLKENNLAGRLEYVDAAHQAVASFASSIVRNDTGLIFATNARGDMMMSTRRIETRTEETENLAKVHAERAEGWREFSLGGERYVGQGKYFEPFDWFIVVAEKADVFYSSVNEIFRRTAIILTVSLFVSLGLLIVFSSLITKPLKGIVDVIREIITTADLSKKVVLRYRDETGELGHYFNLMTGELDKAHGQIKKFALEAVLAKNNEKKIRKIFQKYVPTSVIEQFETNPESMLKGDNRVLSVLFSDIRSFTSISENMHPETLVEALNRYFETMVDEIINRGGIVDKYIGDAIMAFFGAPVKGENDALTSVEAALGMIDALGRFNEKQTVRGYPEFQIGIGINYGVVTVGNIGSEKKMDYTVIGDMVNLASRLEGLTKVYKQQLVFSESVKMKAESKYPCRLLDLVVVKGKSRAVKIYTTKKELSPAERETWPLHEQAMSEYLARNFKEAKELFESVIAVTGDDFPAKLLIQRCDEYAKTPPPLSWQGEAVMTSK